ncbi:hypothetical protein [Vibrio paucivorans]
MRLIALLFSALMLALPVKAGESLPLKCELLETADQFWFYREQMVYQSEQFAIFHNFKGRVVTQVDVKTNELIRTTYLGDSYTPKYQILMGRCPTIAHVLEMWQLDDVPMDN